MQSGCHYVIGMSYVYARRDIPPPPQRSFPRPIVIVSGRPGPVGYRTRMASSSSCGQERDHGSGAAEHPKHIRDKRRDIILKIKEIKPVSGKNLKDVEVPGELYQLAKVVAREESAVKRFTKVEVYRLLLNHAQSNNCAKLEQTEALLDGWELASKALFRYALNLVLAPKTPEFKKMKVI